MPGIGEQHLQLGIQKYLFGLVARYRVLIKAFRSVPGVPVETGNLRRIPLHSGQCI